MGDTHVTTPDTTLRHRVQQAALRHATDDPAGWGRVAIGTRISQMLDPSFFACWSAMLAGGLRAGDALLPPPVGMAAHHAANMLAGMFLATECDTLLTVDHDHTFFPDALEQLRADPRGAPFGMMAALYVSRNSHAPLVLRMAPQSTDDNPLMAVFTAFERGDVVDVDVLPLGFTLIRREVLLDVGGEGGPWFGYITPDATEDIGFSIAARGAGHRLAVNTAVPIGHVIRGTVVPYDDVPL